MRQALPDLVRTAFMAGLNLRSAKQCWHLVYETKAPPGLEVQFICLFGVLTNSSFSVSSGEEMAGQWVINCMADCPTSCIVCAPDADK